MGGGRDIFLRALRGEPTDRVPLLPLVNRLCARLAGCSLQEMQADPALWAGGVAGAATLLEADAVAVAYDPTITAEGYGAEVAWAEDSPIIIPESLTGTAALQGGSRLLNAMEVMRRLFFTARNDLACVAVLTGPVTTAEQMFGEGMGLERARDIKSLYTSSIQAACETRPDLLLFMEGPGFFSSPMGPKHVRIYNTFKNVASYYNIPVGLYCWGHDSESLRQTTLLGLDLVASGRSADGTTPSFEEICRVNDGGRVLPVVLNWARACDLQDFLSRAVEAGRRCEKTALPILLEAGKGDLDLEELRRIASTAQQTSC